MRVALNFLDRKVYPACLSLICPCGATTIKTAFFVFNPNRWPAEGLGDCEVCHAPPVTLRDLSTLRVLHIAGGDEAICAYMIELAAEQGTLKGAPPALAP